MKSTDEIERLLAQTPVPTIAEGPHREQLKQRLLAETQPILRNGENMRMSMFGRMPPLMKLAAALLAAALLIGTGWAAERIYMKWTGLSFSLETSPGRSVTLPDGTSMDLGGGTMEMEVSSTDPSAMETAKRHHAEQNKLIAEKKYKFVGTYELFSQTRYVYTFTFADGPQEKTTVQLPLESVTSWDDYQQKQNEQGEKICKAVAAGRFRLIDVNTIDYWICRDADSHEKLNVRRIFNPGGKDNAKVTLEAAPEPKPMQEMSWQDHLKAIREGKRELLDAKNDTLYTYEAVLEDGSKATFLQDHPLKKPQTK